MPSHKPHQEVEPASQPPKHSPFFKKFYSEIGNVIDLAGRGLATVSFAAMFVKPTAFPFPHAPADFGMGVAFILYGVLLKAEADR